MDETTLFNSLLLLSFLVAAVVFSTLFFIKAPYGRYIQRAWGPLITNNLGWILMESPAFIFFASLFVIGSNPKTLTLWTFFLMWEAHYIHRALIYPFRIADGRKKMPVLVMLMGMIFNSFNTYLNGRYLFSFSAGYPNTWLSDPRFLCGLALFVAGFAINRSSDRILRSLRQPGETGYRIPYGGLFRWVSCPNYLGEIIEWCGWALSTWSLPGLSFAIWTIANLAPRARSHHAWYRSQFMDYPPKRKALLPWIW